ncbi:MAG: hypothetical protein AAGB28_04150 [Pseudomonadota bacterium]
MSGWFVIVMIAVSLTGLGYLARTDAKRRRIFGQIALHRRRFIWPARLAVFGPGLLLVGLGHWSGLMIWAGAVTTLGWAMAAIRPQGYVHALYAADGIAIALKRHMLNLWDLTTHRWTGLRVQLSDLIAPKHHKIVPEEQLATLQNRITSLQAELDMQKGTEVSEPAAPALMSSQVQ